MGSSAYYDYYHPNGHEESSWWASWWSTMMVAGGGGGGLRNDHRLDEFLYRLLPLATTTASPGESNTYDRDDSIYIHSFFVNDKNFNSNKLVGWCLSIIAATTTMSNSPSTPVATIPATDWIKGIALSVLASIIGGASKLAIRKSWILERNCNEGSNYYNENENDATVAAEVTTTTVMTMTTSDDHHARSHVSTDDDPTPTNGIDSAGDHDPFGVDMNDEQQQPGGTAANPQDEPRPPPAPAPPSKEQQQQPPLVHWHLHHRTFGFNGPVANGGGSDDGDILAPLQITPNHHHLGVSLSSSSGASVASTGSSSSYQRAVITTEQPGAVLSRQSITLLYARSLRYAGMVGMTVLNPICCVAAMQYASPSILAPFSGLTLVWIVLGSSTILQESPSKTQIAAASWIIVGEVLVAVFGDHDNNNDNDHSSPRTVHDVAQTYSEPAFVVYMIALVAWMLILWWCISLPPTSVSSSSSSSLSRSCWRWLRCECGCPTKTTETLQRFAWGVSGGSVTGLQNFLKDALTILQLLQQQQQLQPHPQLESANPYYAYVLLSIFIIGAASSAFGGLLCLTACMKRYNATYCASMFVGSFVVSASAMSAAHYHTFQHLYTASQQILYVLGLLILLGGVLMLIPEQNNDQEHEDTTTHRRDEELDDDAAREASGVTATTPSSPEIASGGVPIERLSADGNDATPSSDVEVAITDNKQPPSSVLEEQEGDPLQQCRAPKNAISRRNHRNNNDDDHDDANRDRGVASSDARSICEPLLPMRHRRVIASSPTHGKKPQD